MIEFGNKKFRLLALDEKQTDMIYQVFRQITMGSSMYHMERVLGADCAAEIRKLIADLLEDDMPPEDSPIDGRDQTIARLTRENNRLHNHLHLVEQGVVASIRRFLNENYGPEEGGL